VPLVVIPQIQIRDKNAQEETLHKSAHNSSQSHCYTISRGTDITMGRSNKD